MFRCFIFISLLVSASACTDNTGAALMNNVRWPNLPMTLLAQTKLSEDAASHWRLVNVWATWCEPCRKEMPLLEQLGDAMKDEGLSVILVSIDVDLNLVREFALQYQLRSPIYIASQSDVERLLNNSIYPITYLIAPNNEIKKIYIGVKKWTAPEMIGELKQYMRGSAQL
jgi:thiol-disulfide isomerase/thioredoxin